MIQAVLPHFKRITEQNMTQQAFKFFPLGQLAQHAYPSDEELIMLVDN